MSRRRKNRIAARYRGQTRVLIKAGKGTSMISMKVDPAVYDYLSSRREGIQAWVEARARLEMVPLLRRQGDLPVEERIRLMLCGSEGFLRGARASFTHGFHLPGLALVYCAIDILASLEAPESATVATAFCDWVNTYIGADRLRKVGVGATDLYAARCGLVHEYSPEARWTRNGKALQLIPMFGIAEDLEWKDPDNPRKGTVTNYHVDMLIQAVESGADAFIAAVTSDSDLEFLVRERLDSRFVLRTIEEDFEELADERA